MQTFHASWVRRPIMLICVVFWYFKFASLDILYAHRFQYILWDQLTVWSLASRGSKLWQSSKISSSFYTHHVIIEIIIISCAINIFVMFLRAARWERRINYKTLERLRAHVIIINNLSSNDYLFSLYMCNLSTDNVCCAVYAHTFLLCTQAIW